MPSEPDDGNEPHRRLGEDPPPDAPDMAAPGPPLSSPEPVPAPRRRPRQSRLALVVMVGILAALALGGGTAAFVLLGGEEQEQQEEPAFTPVGTDLTEGLGPFDPAEAEGYHPFTLEQDAWLPAPQGQHWSLQEVGDTSATFHKDAGDDTVILICGDIRDDPGRYPAGFGDHEAWFAAEEARDREHQSADDEYTAVAAPEYGDYVIDGRQAFLVEVQYHWTQWDDPESGPTAVDYTRAHAYLYIDRGKAAPARCSVTAHHGTGDGYDEAVDALLGIRLETAG
ncbi:hypothetical protein [Glycomyces tenuis]|uniref:hypothetical protein n=1 Tax=Glycomyces tenuis TaxID=58116 RepID=UPI0003F75A8F|nr:hypothetical protein [Glycomyces tenuis]